MARSTPVCGNFFALVQPLELVYDFDNYSGIFVGDSDSSGFHHKASNGANWPKTSISYGRSL
jgi:hypothetical protein